MQTEIVPTIFHHTVSHMFRLFCTIVYCACVWMHPQSLTCYQLVRPTSPSPNKKEPTSGTSHRITMCRRWQIALYISACVAEECPSRQGAWKNKLLVRLYLIWVLPPIAVSHLNTATPSLFALSAAAWPWVSSRPAYINSGDTSYAAAIHTIISFLYRKFKTHYLFC
jgi:hypothetical protein